ncbi:43130_t:CDS:2, partial [Gigaspora margarita]
MKKDVLNIDDVEIEIIRKDKVTGLPFLLLTEEKLLNKPYNLVSGPALVIAHLIETLKRRKRFDESKFINLLSYLLYFNMKQLQIKYIKHKVRFYFDARASVKCILLNLFLVDNKNLQEIVKSVMSEVLKDKQFEVINVSNLSNAKMNRIEKSLGLGNLRVYMVSLNCFSDIPFIEYDAFVWDMDKDKEKPMQNVKNWFEYSLNLGEGNTVKNTHTFIKDEVTLEKTRTVLRSEINISIDPRELLVANSAVALDTMVVLTDCSNKWSVFFIIRSEDKYRIVTALVETTEDIMLCDERMLDMIPDMTEEELLHMKIRLRLQLLEKSVRLDEKPIIQ